MPGPTLQSLLPVGVSDPTNWRKMPTSEGIGIYTKLINPNSYSAACVRYINDVKGFAFQATHRNGFIFLTLKNAEKNISQAERDEDLEAIFSHLGCQAADLTLEAFPEDNVLWEQATKAPGMHPTPSTLLPSLSSVLPGYLGTSSTVQNGSAHRSQYRRGRVGAREWWAEKYSTRTAHNNNNNNNNVAHTPGPLPSVLPSLLTNKRERPQDEQSAEKRMRTEAVAQPSSNRFNALVMSVVTERNSENGRSY